MTGTLLPYGSQGCRNRSNVKSGRWAACPPPAPLAKGVVGKPMPPQPPPSLFSTRRYPPRPPIHRGTHSLQLERIACRHCSRLGGPGLFGHASRTARTSSLRRGTAGLVPPDTICGGQLPIGASPSLKEPRLGGSARLRIHRGLQAVCQHACLPCRTVLHALHVWGAPLRHPVTCLSYMPPRPRCLGLVGHPLGVGDRSPLPHVGGGAPSR